MKDFFIFLGQAALALTGAMLVATIVVFWAHWLAIYLGG